MQDQSQGCRKHCDPAEQQEMSAIQAECPVQQLARGHGAQEGVHLTRDRPENRMVAQAQDRDIGSSGHRDIESSEEIGGYGKTASSYWPLTSTFCATPHSARIVSFVRGDSCVSVPHSY